MAKKGLLARDGILFPLAIFAVIFALLIHPLAAYALDEALLDRFAANNIMFYNPEECENNPNKTCVAVSGSQITWIGDSLTALDDWGAGDNSAFFDGFSGVDYGETFNGTSINDYVRSGKKISSTYGDVGPSGIDILKNIISNNKLRPVLVFELGANEGWSKDTLKEVMDLAGSDTQVAILTSHTMSTDYTASNQVLFDGAKEYSNLKVIDWASELKQHEEYFQGSSYDGIHYGHEGYNAVMSFIKDHLPKSCTGSLCGETAREKYWSALSNEFGAAAAAGILGNIDNEGGYNPVGVESCDWLNPYDFTNKTWASGWSWDIFYNNNEATTGVGAFGITSGRADYLHYVNDEAPELMKYFQDPGTYSLGGCSGLPMNGAETGGDALLALIGDADYDRLVELEVAWMYKTCEEAPDSFFDLDYYKSMTDPGEAAIYFLLHYERPYDQGAATQAKRAQSGRDEYEMYKDFKCSSGGNVNTDFSTTDELSGHNNTKYDMEDEQLEKLLKFSIWKADKDNEDYADVLSRILDNYEKNGGGERGNSDELIAYVEDENSSFLYKEDYKKYVEEDGEDSVTVKSEQLEKAKSIVIDGLRTTEDGKVETSDGKDKNKTYCKDDTRKGKGAARIAETAALMSWPVQKGQGDDAHAGMCYDGSRWIQFDWDSATCFHNPRPLYKEAWDDFHSSRGVFDIYEDCGFFVATVIQYLEIGTDAMWNQPYFNEAAEAADAVDWEKVTTSISSEDELKPGDILWDPGHIIIYAGKYGGDYGTFAHASREDRVGAIGNAYGLERWTVYRYIGDKLGGGDIDEEDGLTLDQATQFMINYGANKNDVSRHIVGDSQWYIDCNGNNPSRGLGGSNCVTFSAFYAGKFTSMRYGGGNGDHWVENANGDLTRGTEPKVWSVFSWYSGAFGHTGVILGHHDGEWIVGHASCASYGAGAGDGTKDNGSGFVLHSSDLATALLGLTGDYYAYPDEVDFDAISEFIETGE